MLKIEEIPTDFVFKNIPVNTVKSIEIRWELINRCKDRCISKVCREFSNELFSSGLNYTPEVLRMMYYR
jgi:hypothetical protein